MRPIRGGVTATLALAALALGGCPGSLDNRFFDVGSEVATACSSDDVQQTVFNTSCTMVGCHDNSTSQPSGGLDLLSAGAVQRLVGISTPAGQVCSSSTTTTLVVPGDPAHSLLFLKVEPSPPCGSRMPFGATTALTDRQIECIRSWIAGLPPSTTPDDTIVPGMDATMDVPMSMDVVPTDVVGPTDVVMSRDVVSTDTVVVDVPRPTDVATDHSVPTDTAAPVDAGGVDSGVDP